MVRPRHKPVPPLDSDKVMPTTIGLTPLDQLAARYLARRENRSVSNLFQHLLAEAMTDEEGKHWRDRIADLAAEEGLAP